MMIINPGSGPVRGATQENAHDNIDAFVSDLVDSGIPCLAAEYGHREIEGRWLFIVHTADGRKIEVEMPGLPLDQVRFLGIDGQNIWDFPRLYIDGSSWVWCYALSVCAPVVD